MPFFSVNLVYQSKVKNFNADQFLRDLRRENTMFRSHRFVTTCFAVTAWGSAASAADLEARHQAPLADTVEVTDLQPFTHVAYIPVGASASSIRIESVKAVNVATKRRTVTSTRYCNQPWSDPGGSMLCQRITDESYVPAYRVTYSYSDWSGVMLADEIRNPYFNFSVYFRPDEISTTLREMLSSRKIKRANLAEFFALTTSWGSSQQVVIDQANSTICDGNYVDGNWVRRDAKCEDRIAYKKVATTSPYVTVRVDPGSSRVEMAAAGLKPQSK